MYMTQPQLAYPIPSPRQQQFANSGQIFQQQPVMTLPSAHSTVQSQVQMASQPYQQFSMKKKQEEIIDRESEILQDEELSIEKKHSLNQLNVIFGIVMLICSIAILLFTVFKMDGDAHPLIYFTWKFFLFLGIFMTVFSVLMLLNSFSDAKSISTGKSQSFVGKVVHFLGGLLLGLQITVIFMCMLLIRVGPEVWENQFLNSYWYTLFLLQLVFCGALMFALYTTFQFNRRPATARIMIYVLLICQLVIGFLIIGSSKTVLNLIRIHNVTNIISRELINTVVVIMIVVFVLFVLLFIVNYAKFEVWMFYFGTLFIIITFVLLNIMGAIYRESLDLQSQFVKKNSQECLFSLDLIHKDQIKLYQCEKYTDVDSSPYLSCLPDKQTIMWEPEVGIALTDCINKIVCLNGKCCESASLIIIKELLIHILLDLYFCYCLFLIAVYCFYLIRKHRHEFSLQRQLEFLFFLVFGCLLIVFIILIAKKDAKINNIKDQIIIAEQISVSPASVNNVYLTNNFMNDPKCAIFTQRVKEFNDRLIASGAPESDLTKFEPPEVDSEHYLRVTILTRNFKLQQNQLYNKQKLQILAQTDAKLIKGFFPSINDNVIEEYDFLFVQGERAETINFINTQVYLCTLQPQDQKIQIESKVVSKNNLVEAQPIIIIEQLEKPIQLSNIEKIPGNLVPIGSKSRQFTTLTLHVFSLPESKALEGVVINASPDQRDTCPEALSEDKILYKTTTDKYGKAKLANIAQGNYFLHYSKPGYHCNCIKVSSNEVDKIDLALLKKLDQNQMAFMVSYESKTEDSENTNTVTNLLDLNLYGSFVNEGRMCTVGKGLSSCGGMKEAEFSSKVIKMTKKSSTQVLLLTVDLSGQNYLFYLKNVIALKDYKSLDTQAKKDKLNELIVSSREVSLSVFVSDLVNPAEFKLNLNNLPNAGNAKKEENLVLLLGCVNAAANNQFHEIYKYWIGNDLDAFPKKENQQFPYAGFCENYN